MGLTISVPTYVFDDDGTGEILEKLPLPYWVDVDDERFVNLKAEYQVPKLIFLVNRNGVQQQPKKDFVMSTPTTLEFTEPFVTGECVSFVAVGFSV